MGMFDDIECEYPLPDGYTGPLLKQFQTKDLDCDMTRYRITQDGRLEYWEFNLHPNAEWDGNFGGGKHPFSREDVGWRPVDPPYHGEFEFYGNNVCATGPNGFATDNDGPFDAREYVVRFTNGVVEWIRGGPSDEVARRAADTEWKQITREEFHRKSREAFEARNATRQS